MRTSFTMPKLRYEENALSPIISQETILYHYGKHLQTYVNNLNNLITGTEFANSSLAEIAAKAQGAIGNNAGQVLNHTLYFEQFTPHPKQSEPKNELAKAIKQFFGSFSELQQKLNTSAASLFGSGWVWLCADKQGKLSIEQMPNADNPLRHNLKPILTFDVWEHAYYLDYQNRRADYISALWSIIDWEVIEKRFINP
ncbi:MAG: superoxide dismutase [Paludibacteraceae bacterium]|nr:superoxide dismutase [Paludibacteraceae bacterium]